jgi:RNA polymerase sigma-70 factor (ECF subfamily)
MDAADAPVITTFVAPAGVRRPAIDHEAVVAEAFEAYAGKLTAFARAAVREPDAAEDLVQETYLRFLREVRADRLPDNVAGWLYRVCGNLAISRGRRSSVAERMKRFLVDRRTAPSPEDVTIQSDERQRLQDALQVLPADARVGLLMAAEGYSSDEIAAAIGRTTIATRTYLSRARIRLREVLQEREP